jgi:hypothetical protein
MQDIFGDVVHIGGDNQTWGLHHFAENWLPFILEIFLLYLLRNVLSKQLAVVRFDSPALQTINVDFPTSHFFHPEYRVAQYGNWNGSGRNQNAPL